jgi:hypothetical protein
MESRTLISNICVIVLTVLFGTSLSSTAQAATKVTPGKPVAIVKTPLPKHTPPHPKSPRTGTTGPNSEHAAPVP